LRTDSESFTVLVVEDQDGPRHALQHILGPLCRVRVAATGLAAIDILRSEIVDLVIEDIGLPDINGLDLLKQIKIRWPDTTVIMMTGAGTVQSAEDAMRYGALAYLLKPFSIQELIAMIQDVKSQ
jgi:putative two-component system response regulator